MGEVKKTQRNSKVSDSKKLRRPRPPRPAKPPPRNVEINEADEPPSEIRSDGK